MTYKEAEAFLFDRLPMFQRIGGAAYKKDLGNTLGILEALGNPHLRGKYIHVAGTNGKGSTSSMLASILKESGYRVGLYTSPHLKKFTERIRINGEEIGESDVVSYVAKYRDLISEFSPSFFELTTAMAFDYFAEQEVDIAVIEVGLGGRLDSTNVITPELSIITQIGLDHQQFLGETKEEIVKEKAGIIKKDVPVVTSVAEPHLREIIADIAQQRLSTYYYSKEIYKVIFNQFDSPFWNYRVWQNDALVFDNIQVALGGAYQVQNLETVFASLHILKLRGYDITDNAVIEGLKKIPQNSGLKGRWQILQEGSEGKPKIICDTGHNQAAFDHLITMLTQEKFNELHIVFGAVNDKNPTEILQRLPKSAFYYFTQADVPRAMPAETLHDFARQIGLRGFAYRPVGEAWEAALKKAGENDLIFVGGSTFVVAEIPIL